MIEEPIENIDELVDGILGTSGSPAGGTSSVAYGDTFPKGEGGKTKLYKLACVMCGDVFEAKTPNASYCPDCLKKRKAAGGKMSAAKLHGLRTQPPAGGTSSVASGDTFPKGEGGRVTREGVLDAAKAIICGERENQYGSPEDSFRAIADYWTAYLRQTGNLPEHRELTSEDVAMMMILLKVARQAGRGKLDNWVDIAGYAACGAEIAGGTVRK